MNFYFYAVHCFVSWSILARKQESSDHHQVLHVHYKEKCLKLHLILRNLLCGYILFI